MSESNDKFDYASAYLQQFCSDHKISAATFNINFENAYWPLIKEVWSKFNDNKTVGAFVVAINGAQGSGKSTLSALMQVILNREFGLNVVVLSIDDLYKTRLERQQMARKIHPFFATRGVPGTHDVKLAIDSLSALKNSHDKDVTILPRFSKSNDDRAPPEQWSLVKGAVDIILFEGWCVGTKPQTDEDLIKPVNELEERYDKALVWRKRVNQQLKSQYQKLFKIIDYTIFIKAPNYDCIFDWRFQQEKKLMEKLTVSKQSLSRTMDKTQLTQFMQHYERLTRHNMLVLPDSADVILLLDEKRNSQLVIKRLNDC